MNKTLRIIIFVIGCGLQVFLCGCDLQTPPVTITFRKSLLDSTRVMQLTNRSGSETLVVLVKVRNTIRDTHTSHILKVGPGETEELGRLEMSWVFEPEEEYEVKCDGYRTISGTVP